MPVRGISESLFKRPRRRTALAALALPALAGLLATAVPAAASASTAAPAGTSAAAKAGATSAAAGLSPQVAATAKGTGLAASQRALAAYWTPARMKAALPDSQLPAVLHANTSKSATATPATPQGAGARVAPAAGKATRGSGISPMGYAYYPGYAVGAPPAITTGKVYFTLSGVNYQCSASTVNSEGKSTVWTAGHCVTGAQVWASNWAFVPNCYGVGGNCAAPFGVWYAKSFTVPTAYFNTNDLADDVAGVVMWPQYGYEIDNYLGGQGIEWNYAIGQYMYSFGYPVPGFTGVDLVEASDYTYASPFDSFSVYMFNNMTGGSSGGPWLASFNGSYGYIDGHNDYRYNAYPNYMWSPYYGNQVANVYNVVRYLVG